MDIRAGLERHMEKARRNGSSPEGAERAGLLWLTLTVRKLESKLAARQASELAKKLPIMAGKAVTAKDRVAVLDLQVELLGIVVDTLEQAAMQPGGPLRGKAAAFEGKAIVGMTRDQERDLARLIRRIGGYVADGGRAESVLDYDAAHFERAMQLISKETEPAGDAERRELDRWQSKYGASP